MFVCNSNYFTQVRTISYKSIRTWYAGLVKPKKIEPPYKHIIQIGDPTLRNKCEPVPENLIKSREIEYLLNQMKYVLKKYNCIGLSAPQIGVPVRIFIVEFNREHGKAFSNQEFKNMEMELLPQTIVINPEIKVIDYTKIVFSEGCESVKGFWAEVPRFRAIELKGLNENGEPTLLKAKGWNARIIQHEMDHLNGVIYTDIMDRKSLSCSCWNEVNEHGGKVELPYGVK